MIRDLILFILSVWTAIGFLIGGIDSAESRTRRECNCHVFAATKALSKLAKYKIGG